MWRLASRGQIEMRVCMAATSLSSKSCFRFDDFFSATMPTKVSETRLRTEWSDVTVLEPFKSIRAANDSQVGQ